LAKSGNERKRVVIIAGPNGAGKSTVAQSILRGTPGVRHFVNADAIARGLSEYNSEEMAIPAGKIMLSRLRELAGRQENFAFETTLASRTFAPWIRTLLDQGYSFHLLFIWLPTVQMAIQRVQKRVEGGGHGIPTLTIERRYQRGIANFFELYHPIANNWRVYNNAEPQGPRLIASGGHNRRIRIYEANQWRDFSSGVCGCG
jgi:predicted ABC-type ATPase